MAVVINFGVLVVNNLTNNAGLFFGENASQQGWDSPTKTNEAQGIYGVGCVAVNSVNINIDPDLVDTLTNHNNLNAPMAPLIIKAI